MQTIIMLMWVADIVHTLNFVMGTIGSVLLLFYVFAWATTPIDIPKKILYIGLICISIATILPSKKSSMPKSHI